MGPKKFAVRRKLADTLQTGSSVAKTNLQSSRPFCEERIDSKPNCRNRNKCLISPSKDCLQNKPKTILPSPTFVKVVNNSNAGMFNRSALAEKTLSAEGNSGKTATVDYENMSQNFILTKGAARSIAEVSRSSKEFGNSYIDHLEKQCKRKRYSKEHLGKLNYAKFEHNLASVKHRSKICEKENLSPYHENVTGARRKSMCFGQNEDVTFANHKSELHSFITIRNFTYLNETETLNNCMKSQEWQLPCPELLVCDIVQSTSVQTSEPCQVNLDVKEKDPLTRPVKPGGEVTLNTFHDDKANIILSFETPVNLCLIKRSCPIKRGRSSRFSASNLCTPRSTGKITLRKINLFKDTDSQPYVHATPDVCHHTVDLFPKALSEAQNILHQEASLLSSSKVVGINSSTQNKSSPDISLSYIKRFMNPSHSIETPLNNFNCVWQLRIPNAVNNDLSKQNTLAQTESYNFNNTEGMNNIRDHYDSPDSVNSHLICKMNTGMQVSPAEEPILFYGGNKSPFSLKEKLSPILSLVTETNVFKDYISHPSSSEKLPKSSKFSKDLYVFTVGSSLPIDKSIFYPGHSSPDALGGADLKRPYSCGQVSLPSFSDCSFSPVKFTFPFESPAEKFDMENVNKNGMALNVDGIHTLNAVHKTFVNESAKVDKKVTRATAGKSEKGKLREEEKLDIQKVREKTKNKRGKLLAKMNVANINGHQKIKGKILAENGQTLQDDHKDKKEKQLAEDGVEYNGKGCDTEYSKTTVRNRKQPTGRKYRESIPLAISVSKHLKEKPQSTFVGTPEKSKTFQFKIIGENAEPDLVTYTPEALVSKIKPLRNSLKLKNDTSNLERAVQGKPQIFDTLKRSVHEYYVGVARRKGKCQSSHEGAEASQSCGKSLTDSKKNKFCDNTEKSRNILIDIEPEKFLDDNVSVDTICIGTVKNRQIEKNFGFQSRKVDKHYQNNNNNIVEKADNSCKKYSLRERVKKGMNSKSEKRTTPQVESEKNVKQNSEKKIRSFDSSTVKFEQLENKSSKHFTKDCHLNNNLFYGEKVLESKTKMNVNRNADKETGLHNALSGKKKISPDGSKYNINISVKKSSTVRKSVTTKGRKTNQNTSCQSAITGGATINAQISISDNKRSSSTLAQDRTQDRLDNKDRTILSDSLTMGKNGLHQSSSKPDSQCSVDNVNALNAPSRVLRNRAKDLSSKGNTGNKELVMTQMKENECESQKPQKQAAEHVKEKKQNGAKQASKQDSSKAEILTSGSSKDKRKRNEKNAPEMATAQKKTKKKKTEITEKPKAKATEKPKAKTTEKPKTEDDASFKQKSLKFVGAHCSIAGGVSKAVAEAASLHARAFGLFVRNGRSWKLNPLDSEEAEKFKANCKEYGFPSHLILPHGSYLLNCGSSNPETLRKSRDTFVHELQICEMLNLTLYNFHPGSACGDGTVNDCIKTIAESINLAHQETKFVKTVIENMAGQGQTVGGKFEELKAIIDNVNDKSRIGVCLDTCHAFAAGFDLSTEVGFNKFIADFDKIVGLQYLSAMHLNDSKGAMGCHLDRHENIGKGHIGIEGFRYIMNDHRLNNIPMILETPVNDYAKEIQILYNLENSKG